MLPLAISYHVFVSETLPKVTYRFLKDFSLRKRYIWFSHCFSFKLKLKRQNFKSAWIIVGYISANYQIIINQKIVS